MTKAVAKKKLSKKTAATVPTTKSAEIDPSFQPIVDAYAKDPAVTVGKVFRSVGLKVNGKLFALFSRGRFVTKLPAARVAALVDAGKGAHFDRGDGKPLKEWHAITDAPATWRGLAKEAYAFVKAGKQ